mgnify:CR=1 FL=1
MHLVEHPLDADLGAGFQRKGARLGLELGSCEGAFDVTRARVVSLDQVRVVAIHHPDQVCQFGSAVRVQALSQPCRLALDFDRKVRQAGRYVLFEEARFDPAGRLYHFLPILSVQNLKQSLPFYAMKSKLLPMYVADHGCRCSMSSSDAFEAS